MTVAEQWALHPDHVVPGAELPADVAVDADLLEAHRAVQPGAGLVGERHAGDGGAKATLGQTLEQGLVERTAGAAAPPPCLDVDADLARPAICGAAMHGTAVGVADDPAGVLEDEARLAAAGG